MFIEAPDGRTIFFDGIEEEKSVVEAWCNPGRQPIYHRQMALEVRNKMPVLAKALDVLANKYGRGLDVP